MARQRTGPMVLQVAGLPEPDWQGPVSGRIVSRGQWPFLPTVRPGAWRAFQPEGAAQAPSSGSLSTPATLTHRRELTAIGNENRAHGQPGNESRACPPASIGYGKSSQQIPDSYRQPTNDLYGCTFCPFCQSIA